MAALLFSVCSWTAANSQKATDTLLIKTDTLLIKIDSSAIEKIKEALSFTPEQLAGNSADFAIKKADRQADNLKAEVTGNNPLKIFSSPKKSGSKSQVNNEKKSSSISKPLIHLGGGYISYNWNHRSGIDSSIIENNISQHIVTGHINATIAQTIPLRITYFERQSTSVFFKDFRDIRVDLDVQRYRQLRLQKAMTRWGNPSMNLRDPMLLSQLNSITAKTSQFKDLLNDPLVIKELLQAKETLIRKNFSDTSRIFIDSLKERSALFIHLYDSLRLKLTRYEQLHDSLYIVYQRTESRIKKIEQLLTRKNLSYSDLQQIQGMPEMRMNRSTKLGKAYSGLRALSVGQTVPNFSSLTLQNVNVNGFNIEYNKNDIYVAAAAGVVDFRIRDFLYSKQKPPRQYVYSARFGWGKKEADNIILTYYRGKKQLFWGNPASAAAEIQGISLAGQFFPIKQVRVFGEIAQSGVPYSSGNNYSSRKSINLKDEAQRAYLVGLSSYIPQSQTRVEGNYQHTGINYQSFNGFQYNATTNSWSFRIEQSFWKRQITLQAAVRKNDFVNPFVLQRYNANTVFKNFTLTFRKVQWPLISIGYIPASQYTAVGGLVYENHYQTFTGNISHQYKLGVIKGGTVVTISQFFNDSRDSGFVYFNSRNFFVRQAFLFNLFTATLNVSGMKNGQYQLYVFEEGLSATFFKKFNAGFAVKINNLNTEVTKVGFNASTRITLKYIGSLNVWMDQNYLPSMQKGLYKYEMYNLGLIRYF